VSRQVPRVRILVLPPERNAMKNKRVEITEWFIETPTFEYHNAYQDPNHHTPDQIHKAKMGTTVEARTKAEAIKKAKIKITRDMGNFHIIGADPLENMKATRRV
jgi:hypothetical protein